MPRTETLRIAHFADRTLCGPADAKALDAAHVRNTGRAFISPSQQAVVAPDDPVVRTLGLLLQQEDECPRELWHADLSVRRLAAAQRGNELDAYSTTDGVSDSLFTHGYRVVPLPDTSTVRSLLDARYGIVTNIYRDLTSDSNALVGAEFTRLGNRITAYGRGVDFETAERLCLLELVERHAMYGPQRLLLQSTLAAMEAGHRVLRPEEVLHYVQEAVPGLRDPFDPCAKMGWVNGVDLREGTEIWLPAQLAYLAVEGETVWGCETSNGVALGATDAEAQLFALTELVERDAFMTFWFGRRVPRKVITDSLPVDARRRIAEATDAGAVVHVLDLSVLAGLAVIMVVVLGRDSTVATYQSTAAHPDPAQALSSALDEALVGFHVYERNPDVPGPELRPEEVASLNDHVRWAAHRNQGHIYDWVLADPVLVDFDQVRGAADTPGCASAASAHEFLECLLAGPLAELRCIGVDLSTRLSNSIGCRVWRVLSPDVSPMWFGYQQRRINRRALRARLRAAGGSGVLPAPGEVPLVHPYA